MEISNEEEIVPLFEYFFVAACHQYRSLPLLPIGRGETFDAYHDPMPKFTCKQIVIMGGMLATGSINTLCKKAQNDFIVKGYMSPPHGFKHPWVQTWMVCLAMAMSLIGLPFQRKQELQEYRKQAELSKTEEESVQQRIEIGPPVQARLVQWILMIPACTVIIANSLSGIGLLYVDASVFVLMRGSNIIFAGILSKLFLKRKLKATHWLGMMIAMLGLLLAGCSSVFKNQKHLGISLILVSQIVTACQMTLEETLLKRRQLHPLHVVGMKGTYAVVLMTFIVLPVLYFIPGDGVGKRFENSLDALYQIYNNSKLLTLCFLFTGSVALYNFFAFSVIKSFTAVHRTLIDACRVIIVWGVSLIIYYAFDKNFGEPFDESYGILQVDGFLFLVIGTAMYNQLFDLKNFVPFCTFTTEEAGHNSQGNLQDENGCIEEAVTERSRLLEGRKT